jgi:putative drug exporter of the RND superfamily
MELRSDGRAERGLTMKTPSIAGLTRISAAHPWRVVAAWGLVLLLAIAIMGTLGLKTTTEMRFTNDPESQTGMELLERAGLEDDNPTDETVIIQAEGATVDDAAYREHVERVAAALRALDGIVLPETVATYYELAASPATVPMAAGLVSEDGRTTLIPLTLAGTQDEAVANTPAYLAAIADLGGDGFTVSSVGPITIGEESGRIADEDMARGEMVGVGAALVILVVVFGALVAAGLPILLALAAITISFGITALLGQVWDLSFFITSMITMIGLAVGIDYALFVVERYREERRNGAPKQDAIALAGGTAAKAVAFSGGTVVLALSGLFLMPDTLFRALAAGAVIVVVIAMVATMTLVPAVLGLLGDRIDWPRRRDYEAYARAHSGHRLHSADTVYTGFWGRVTRAVMARPVVAVVAATTLLVAAAIPYWDINTGFAGVEAMPADSEGRQGFEILDAEFSAGVLAPVQIAVAGDPDDVAAAIEQLRNEMNTMAIPGTAGEPAFLPIPEREWTVWSETEDVALLEATMTHVANDERSYATIVALRDEVVPAAFDGVDAEVYVTGDSAFSQDFFDLAERYQPIILAFVLTMSFLLLLLAFRSIVVSAKAILMNLLSVGAAYGLLVLVFQKGVGNELLGLQRTPTIEAWIPIFLFCILFGLSMDYHVFLLSRIREHYDATGDNAESVAVGLKATGRIITGAALIMVAVFSGFAAGRLVMLQQIGFGLGVAVLLDATLVRSVLVPAAMALLGDANWYLPRWLGWLPDLRVEGPTAGRDASAPGAASMPTEGTQRRGAWDPSAP